MYWKLFQNERMCWKLFQNEGMYWKKGWSNKKAISLKQMYLYELYDSCRFFAHAKITDSSTKK